MEQNDANILTVEIRYDGTECKAVPGSLEVENQNKVRIQNKTEKRIVVSFSAELLFNVTKKPIDPEKHLDLTTSKVPRGIYPYAVYCEVTNDFATGSEMPIIIVRR